MLIYIPSILICYLLLNILDASFDNLPLEDLYAYVYILGCKTDTTKNNLQ